MPILLAGLLPAGLAAQTIVLTDVNIIDGNGGPVQEGMTIVIQGERIASITEGPYESSGAGDGADVHDLDGAWVLPGFWNMHVHLSVMFPHNHALDDELAPSKVIRAGLNAIDGLRHGFTSIRSVGEQDYIDVAWGLAFPCPRAGGVRRGRGRSRLSRARLRADRRDDRADGGEGDVLRPDDHLQPERRVHRGAGSAAGRPGLRGGRGDRAVADDGRLRRRTVAGVRTRTAGDSGEVGRGWRQAADRLGLDADRRGGPTRSRTSRTSARP